MALVLAWLAAGVGAPLARGQSVHRVDGLAAVVGGTAPGAGVVTVLRSDAWLGAALSASRDARARDRSAGDGRAIDGPDGRGAASDGRAGEAPGGTDTPGSEAGDAVPQEPAAAPVVPALGADALGRALDELVGEALIAAEAERVGIPRPGPAALAREARALEGLAGGPERLAALARLAGLDAEALERWVARRALVRAFLDANLEGTPVVTEAQLRSTWAAGGHPFTDLPFPEAREPLRAWLARRALQAAVARWVRVLRSRSEVRILVPWPSRFDDSSSEPGVEDAEPAPSSSP